MVIIVGYEQEGRCDHCGRSLKHVIKLDDGRKVGATCLANKLTKPLKDRHGREFRLPASCFVDRAKMAEYWSPAKCGMNGFGPEQFKFEEV